jgi:hypothetical protein
MHWEEALEAANRIDVRVKQAAYELSYRYLDGGPELLAARERQLRQAVADVPADAELSVDLGRDLFAWQNATYMARRRLPWDLPPAWADAAPDWDSDEGATLV